MNGGGVSVSQPKNVMLQIEGKDKWTMIMFTGSRQASQNRYLEPEDLLYTLYKKWHFMTFSLLILLEAIAFWHSFN